VNGTMEELNQHGSHNILHLDLKFQESLLRAVRAEKQIFGFAGMLGTGNRKRACRGRLAYFTIPLQNRSILSNPFSR
jgi:hypothetical protein